MKQQRPTRHRSKLHVAAAVLCALVGAAGCGGGGSGPSATAFVKNQLERTSDDAEPADVNGLDLQFQENTAVFAPLFQ